MPESSKPPRHPPSPELKEELRGLGDRDWQMIFMEILTGVPINYNIDFSDIDPQVRIDELYRLIIENGLNPLPLQAAIVRLLQEHYREAADRHFVYYLVQAVDQMRPGIYFDRLLQLIIKPEYANMIEVEGPDGLSVHYRLLNAVMRFDLDRRLLVWLLSRALGPQRPEFYQVAIRYLYSYCGQQEFNRFMKVAYTNCDNQGIRGMVVRAYREYLFYENEFRLLVGWLAELTPRLLEDPDYIAFRKLADDIVAWLEGESSVHLRTKTGYHEVCWYLYPFIERDVDEPAPDNGLIASLQAVPQELFYDRKRLISYLQRHVIKVSPVPQGKVVPITKGVFLLDDDVVEKTRIVRYF